MPANFEYFVILAEMRTGSNYLEQSLEEYPGLKTYGELFNPSFVGGHNKFEMLGMSLSDRDRNPGKMIRLVRDDANGMAGFRMFHDHHPTALNICLDDPACAKIVLTRNPLESYISEKIARQTDQWRLSDMKNARTAQVVFDSEEFQDHLESRKAFQASILARLQRSGQTAFYLSYEDIPNPDILNGLVRFLGLDAKKGKASKKTKKQNPQPIEEKVANYEDMQAALKSIDTFALAKLPNFEPRRGPAVPRFMAATRAPLLFMPVAGGPTDAIRQWLARIDRVGSDDLLTGFNQKSLRAWMKDNPGHRKFTVLRHPVHRLHDAFVRHMISPGPGHFSDMVQTLRTRHAMPIPSIEDADYGPEAHRAGFLAFAGFVRAGLGGQTALRVDSSWASQAELLAGMSAFALPDYIFREDELGRDLAYMAEGLKLPAPEWVEDGEPGPISLQDIYDNEVEAAVRAACNRDYVAFGFGAWR